MAINALITCSESRRLAVMMVLGTVELGRAVAAGTKLIALSL
jgi:hypothetical protein